MKYAAWLLIGLLFLGPVSATEAWQTLQPGLQVLRFSWHSTDLVAVKASPSRYRLRVLPYSTSIRADEMRRRSGAVVTINGPFFDTDGRPMGLLVASGRTVHPMPPPSSANGSVLAVRAGHVLIERRQDYRGDGVTEAVQCAPRLIADGQPTGQLLDAEVPAARTVVAVTRAGDILLLCSASAADRVSLSDMQRILLLPTFGAWQAMALDGGASTQMSISAGRYHTEVVAPNAVPVGLGLFSR